jgi:tetratricopeptide (TPR) repeat protein
MLTAAAERALNGAAFESALRLVDDALALMDETDDERMAALLELRGTALRALGRLDDCVPVLQQAVARYLRAENRGAAVLLSWQMGVSQMWLGNFEGAFVTFDAGLRAVGDEPIPERLLVAGGLGALVGFAGMYDPAMSAVRDAQAVSGDVTDELCLGVMAWSISTIAWSLQRLEDGIVSGREAMGHLRNTTNAWALSDAAAWLSFPLLWSGRREEALAVAAEGAEIAAKVGNIGTRSLCERTVAWANYLLDADADANTRAAEADLPILGLINSPWVALTNAWLSSAYQTQGRFAEAVEQADEAIRVMPASGWTGMGEAAKLLALALSGDRTGCLALIDDPQFAVPNGLDPHPAGAVFRFETLLMSVAILGLEDHARRLYPAAVQLAERSRYLWFDLTIAERLAGMVALTAGLFDEAEQHLNEATRIAAEDPNPLDAPHVDYWFAKMLLCRGRAEDRDEAIRRATFARDEFARRNVPPYLAMSEALVQELA